MIVVTGANGALGRGVVKRLLTRVPASRVRATARRPEDAAALAASGVDVRKADFERPEDLREAFSGAERILIVSVNRLGEVALRLHRAAVAAASAAGAGHIVYTSHMGARPDSAFAAGRDHAETESVLAACGPPFTALRHGFYAESALHMVGKGIEAGEIRTPDDGPVSWTARADLADADAAMLVVDVIAQGPTRPLTSREAFTMAEIAAAASEISGRDIRHVVLSDEAWVAERVAGGSPEPMARLLLGFFKAARRGDFAATDPSLERLIGRPPSTMRDVLAGVLTSGSARG